VFFLPQRTITSLKTVLIILTGKSYKVAPQKKASQQKVSASYSDICANTPGENKKLRIGSWTPDLFRILCVYEINNSELSFSSLFSLPGRTPLNKTYYIHIYTSDALRCVQTFWAYFCYSCVREEQRRRKVAVLYIIKKICMHKTEHFILLANPVGHKNFAKVGVARKMAKRRRCFGISLNFCLFIMKFDSFL